ncbi:meiotically up-regulated gene 157 protein [Martensiomyces pterosporus]|nr:meiotically up-regulated gene 157 protein [Martensiomyces pterosporus]
MQTAALTIFAALPAHFALAVTSCPSYMDWSSEPHAPYSLGRNRIPTMRPPLECRTFTSPTIERALNSVASAIRDPDWRQLFTNIFPNTLDTTVAWHYPNDTEPYSFLVTGDITAQWIRDSANQLLPYLPYAASDPSIAKLILGLVNMQAEELVEDVFGNAFQPPPRSGLQPTANGIAVDLKVAPPFNNVTVFEAKFEIDSLASFLQISTSYWRATGDSKFLASRSWVTAVRQILSNIRRLQEPTYSAAHMLNPAVVAYKRLTDSATETQFGGGRGNPVKHTGMVRTLFRPSDDATIFPFLVPANAFLSVELSNLSQMLQTLNVYPDLAQEAKQRSDEIRAGVLGFGTALHPKHGRVFVYETDGYGSSLVMDDANGPALLSLPYLGFVPATDPIYQNTRRLILSPDDNPWYFTGPYIQGVGSPHTGFMKVWPMAVTMQALTSVDRAEVKGCLDVLLASTSGLGLMHESVSVTMPSDYTRSWFAWCNSLTAQLVVDAVTRFPGII